MVKTRNLYEDLQNLVEEYAKEHGLDAVDLDKVAEWAVKEKKYTRQPKSIEKQCRAELSRALQAQRYKDPQGRTVRAKLPVVLGEQLILWVDIRTAHPNHMLLASQQRRRGIFADVVRLKTDMESYNDNNPHGVQLELFSFDFDKDIQEAAHPTVYVDEMQENESVIDFDIEGRSEV